MKYKSTRGGVKGVSFSEVVLSSYAPDGGMYVPERVPLVERERLRSWASLGYLELLQEILSLFVSPEELSRQEMQTVLDGVYDTFDVPSVLPVVEVGPLHVAETWHGPTGVFKDLTLPVLTRLCDHFLEKRGQRATILVSTTGDTGGTTIRSAMDRKNLRCIVAYPRNTVSRVQELQMTATGASNAVVFSYEGVSDDIDLILMNILRDKELQSRHILLSFNSIHTVRVLLNIVQYFFVYLRLVPNADRRVLISVPTGGMGNTTGAVMASEMGLPIKILAAVTENDIAHRALTLGDYSITRPQIPTFAPSLDTNLPHNIERVFYYALDGDTAAVKKTMEDFERKQSAFFPGKARQNLLTGRVEMRECLEMIKRVWKEFGYFLCPHTAVAWKPAEEYALRNRDRSNGDVTDSVEEEKDSCQDKECNFVVVMATATPAKFPETLAEVGVQAPSAERLLKGLEGKEERKLVLNKGEDWEQAFRDAIASSQGFFN